MICALTKWKFKSDEFSERDAAEILRMRPALGRDQLSLDHVESEIGQDHIGAGPFEGDQ